MVLHQRRKQTRHYISRHTIKSNRSLINGARKMLFPSFWGNLRNMWENIFMKPLKPCNGTHFDPEYRLPLNQASATSPQLSDWFTQQSTQLLQQLSPMMNQMTQTDLASIAQPQLQKFQTQMNTGESGNAC